VKHVVRRITDVGLNHYFVDKQHCGYTLSRPFIVEIDGRIYEAPEGMPTDGASIPRFFWRIVGHPMDPQFLPAATWHDAACIHQLRGFHGDNCEAADIFGWMLGETQVAAWRIRAMVRAVKLGGPKWKADE
jgi:hypothetical protein